MRKGRSKRTNRRNGDYEWDDEEGRQVLKPHVLNSRRKKAAKRREEKKAQEESDATEQGGDEHTGQHNNQGEKPRNEEPQFDREHQPEYKANQRFKPWIRPTKPHPSPCTCSEEEQLKVNKRLYKELMTRAVRAFDKSTGGWDRVVINRRFQRRYIRHMGHFEAYLEQQNIRYSKL